MDNTEIIPVTRGDYETLLRQARAEGEKAARNIGRPGSPFATKADFDDDIERRRHIAKWLIAVSRKDFNGLDALRTEVPEFYSSKANFNETTAAQGESAVPSVWVNEIFYAADNYGFARRMFNVVPMTTKTQKMLNGVGFSAAFVSEGAAATLSDSSNHFAQPTLTAKLCKVALLLSEELEEDAISDLIPYFTREMARAVAKAEDVEAFKGGSAFDGICTITGANEVNMTGSNDGFENVSWTDLVDLPAAVPTADLDNAVFVMPRSVWAYLRKETQTSTNVPIWNRESPADLAGQQGLQALGSNVRWTPLGYPAVVVPNDIWKTTAADTVAVAFGDFSRYAIFGDRKSLTEKTFNEYYNSTALSGQNRVMEFSERVAIAWADEGAFATLHTAS